MRLTGSGEMEAKSKLTGGWEEGDGGPGKGESTKVAQFWKINYIQKKGKSLKNSSRIEFYRIYHNGIF